MNWRDLPGHVVMSTAVLAVALLLWYPPSTTGLLNRPVRLHALPAGEQLDLTVPPNTLRVRLISVAAPPTDPWGATGPSATYRLQAAWLDADDKPLRTELITLQSASSRSARVAADAPPPPAVLDPRAVDLTVPPDAAPATLRLTLLAGVPELAVRAYSTTTPTLHPDELLIQAHERRTRSLTHRIHRASWHEVSRAEALALVDERWSSLAPREGSQDRAQTYLVRREPADALQRRAAGVSLRRDDAISWLVQGPVVLEIASLGPLEHAELWAITEGVGDAPLIELEAPSQRRWAEGVSVRRVHLPTAGQTSLHLHHRGASALHGVVLVQDLDQPSPEHAERSATLDWNPAVGDAPLESVVPTYIYEPVYAPGDGEVRFTLPATPERSAVRLNLRPLRPEGSSTTTAVQLVLRTPDGAEHTETVTLPWSSEGYERIGPTRNRWDLRARVGESEDHYAWWGPGPAELIVRSAEPTVVSASLRGPLRGEHRAEDSSGLTRLRFARDALTSWTPLPPSNLPELSERGGVLQLSANLRRELVHPETHHYRSVRVLGRQLSGEPFLVPLGADDLGLTYCRYTPTSAPARFAWDPRAAAAFDGVLSLTVWSPGAAQQPQLGETWSLELDGLAWRTERFEGPVRRLDQPRLPARTLQLNAPDGTTLWARTWSAPGARCAEPYRPLLAHRVPPGGSLSVRLTREAPSQRVSVSGFGEQAVRVEVALESVEPTLAVFTDRFTPRAQDLELLPVPRDRYTSLLRPWLRLPALTPKAVVLRDDLGEGPVQVRLTNLGESPAWLRLALEDPSLGPQEPAP